MLLFMHTLLLTAARTLVNISNLDRKRFLKFTTNLEEVRRGSN